MRMLVLWLVIVALGACRREKMPDQAAPGPVASSAKSTEPIEDAAELVSRADELESAGDDAAARHAYDRALRLDPGHIPAWIARGHLRYRTGDREGALADYTRAVELDPDNAAAYYHRGYAHEARREIDEAIADYSRAIELDAEMARAWMSRSIVKGMKGDYDGASRDRARYQELIRTGTGNDGGESK